MRDVLKPPGRAAACGEATEVESGRDLSHGAARGLQRLPSARAALARPRPPRAARHSAARREPNGSVPTRSPLPRLWRRASRVRSPMASRSHCETLTMMLRTRRPAAERVSSTLRLWDLETGAKLRRFEGQGVTVVALLADGRRALSGSWDNTLLSRAPVVVVSATRSAWPVSRTWMSYRTRPSDQRRTSPA